MKQSLVAGSKLPATSNQLLATIVALVFAVSAFAQATDYHDIKTPPLRNFNPPVAKRIKFDNGMVVFLMEDHELPLIRGSAEIRGGAREVPAAKAGLAGIYGAAWRTGGTQDKTGDQLDEMLESRAARIETGGGEDATSIRFDVLKNDLDFVFPIWLDLLRNPEFRQEKIDLAKTQANTGISRRNDNPEGIIGREAQKLGYGPDSPYARQTEYATIAAITRDDLLAFHKQYVYPNNIIIGIAGDFDSKAMEAKLRDAFAKWPKGPQAPPPPPVGAGAKPGVYFIAKDDVTQSNIALVGPGILRNVPDYYAVVVMNEILSGGFSGRLMNDIRTKRGLAYGVGGGIGAGWDHPGLTRVRMGTKSGTTVEAVEVLKQNVADLRTKPFTAEEMSLAKDAILNAFIFTMDSPEKVIGQQISLEFYGFPLDYYRNFPANIQKVTAEQVAAAAQKYVHPEQLSVLVVGNQKDFDKPLSTLGTVTPIDITIPEPGNAPAAANAKPVVSNDEGKALIEKARAFAGGKEKLAAVKATHVTISMVVKGPQGGDLAIDMDNTVVFPDRVHTVMTMPMGQMTSVFTPDAAFVVGPMGTNDMRSEQRESTLRDLRADVLALLIYADEPGRTYTATGSEKIGDVNAKIVEVHANNNTVKLWIDPATGRILRKAATVRTPQGPAEQVTDYSEWKTFGGLQFATHYTSTRNGEPFGRGEVKVIEVNPTVDPALFVKK